MTGPKKVFFTSDQHYGHTNIIEYCKRPFSSVEEMDEVLIQNHNKVVKPWDTVYMLGDLAIWRSPHKIVDLARKLNGTKILIMGNHDKITPGFPGKEVFRFMELIGSNWDGFDPTLCHFPMLSWNKSHHGTFQLHGHTHGNIPFDPKIRRLDVGVDCWNYTPVSWEEVRAKLEAVPAPALSKKRTPRVKAKAEAELI